VIVVPSLAERLQQDPDELARLLHELVKRLTGDESPELADEVQRVLRRHPGPDYPWPGNVRELEQATRRVLLTGRYEPTFPAAPPGASAWLGRAEAGELEAEDLLAAYCAHLHQRHGTYEEVARVTRLDRRTVKKYIGRAP